MVPSLLQSLGGLLIVSALARAMAWVWLYLWLPRRKQAPRLAERYGRGSWVLLTGAGDGLGKAFAEQFADAGFNLLLVSRTPDKLRRLQAELEVRGIEVRTLAVDLGGDADRSSAEIAGVASNLDLSVVVNCVGATVHRRYADIPPNTLRRLLAVNVETTASVTHATLPLLLRHAEATGRRSALLNVGSIVGRFPWPGTQVYGASKAFIHHLTVPLGFEYRGRLDVLSFQPTVMATAMATGTEPAWVTIPPAAAAAAALAHLGHVDRSHGHWRHGAMAAVLSVMPRPLRDRLLLAEALKMGDVELGRG